MREVLDQSARMGFIEEDVSSGSDSEGINPPNGRSPQSAMSDVDDPSDEEPVKPHGRGRAVSLAPGALIRRSVIGRGWARLFTLVGERTRDPANCGVYIIFL